MPTDQGCAWWLTCGAGIKHHDDVVGQTGDVAIQMNDVGGKLDWGAWVTAGLGHGWFQFQGVAGVEQGGKGGGHHSKHGELQYLTLAPVLTHILTP